MDYCKSCGSEVALGTHRCPSCGDVIDEFASPTSTDGDQLHREIRDLARREGLIPAVKRYREATGCDLKTAKDTVERLMAGGSVPEVGRPVPVEHLEAQVLDLARTEGKLVAIKHYREATGCGLKDAKDAVEALLQEHGVQPRAKAGCAGVVLLLLFVGFSGWWLGS